MKTYAFDGADMDWEYPGVEWSGGRPMDKANFVTFIQELRTAFNNLRRRRATKLEITMAVSVVEANINVGYDVPRLCGWGRKIQISFI